MIGWFVLGILALILVILIVRKQRKERVDFDKTSWWWWPEVWYDPYYYNREQPSTCVDTFKTKFQKCIGMDPTPDGQERCTSEYRKDVLENC